MNNVQLKELFDICKVMPEELLYKLLYNALAEYNRNRSYRSKKDIEMYCQMVVVKSVVTGTDTGDLVTEFDQIERIKQRLNSLS